MAAGAVAALQASRQAATAARLVMQHSSHTLLAGPAADAFAREMGLPAANLSTPRTAAQHRAWWVATLLSVVMACNQPHLSGLPVSPRCYRCSMLSCRRRANCQPNFRRNVVPDPTTSCGPYQPGPADSKAALAPPACSSGHVRRGNHDTIAMVAIDGMGNVAAGASSNGASHKVSITLDSRTAVSGTCSCMCPHCIRGRMSWQRGVSVCRPGTRQGG